MRTNPLTGELEHYWEERGSSSASPAHGVGPTGVGTEGARAVARNPGDPRNRAVNPDRGPVWRDPVKVAQERKERRRLQDQARRTRTRARPQAPAPTSEGND